MYILCIDYSSNAYDMPIPRYIATLALMPKSALNKYWRYIEGALYIHRFAQAYLLLETVYQSNNVTHMPLVLCFSDMYRPSNF